MGLIAADLARGVDHVAALEPGVAAALARVGYPPERIRPRGYGSLLRAIIGQQISVKAADGVWRKLEAAVGRIEVPAAMLAMSPEDLRAAGLSRQKASYVHDLARAVTDGRLDFDALPADDESAVALISSVRGIGRWSAEVYLLFCEGRADVFPAGDLAVQVELGRMLELDARPTEKAARARVEPWAPHRGAMAVFLWHSYNAPPL